MSFRAQADADDEAPLSNIRDSRRFSTLPKGAMPARHSTYSSLSHQDYLAPYRDSPPTSGRRVSTYDDFNVAYESTDTLSSAAKEKGNIVAVPTLGKDFEPDEDRADAWRQRKGFFRQTRARLAAKASWRIGIFVVVGLLVVLALVLFFCIPRTPSLQYNVAAPISATGEDARFTQVPGNFSFGATLQLAIDASDNWLPLAFSDFTINVKEGNTGQNIARGTLSVSSVPGRKVTPISAPVDFLYASTNYTDPTWQAVYKACQHEWPGQPTRPQLSLRVIVDLAIKGKIGKAQTSTAFQAPCPFELPGNV